MLGLLRPNWWSDGFLKLGAKSRPTNCIFNFVGSSQAALHEDWPLHNNGAGPKVVGKLEHLERFVSSFRTRFSGLADMPKVRDSQSERFEKLSGGSSKSTTLGCL